MIKENVSPCYESKDGQRVEAIAKTLMAEFYSRELVAEAADRTTLRALATKGDPRAVHCVTVAGVLMNYLREEIE